ncbi:hypothetical protein CR513_52685, partial [Mucuna pruriens]
MDKGVCSVLDKLRALIIPSPHPNHGHQGIALASLQLNVPRLDGSDSLKWIFKISQFFEFHHMSEALNWLQWMHANGKIHLWPNLLTSIELRFAPSQYEDPRGALVSTEDKEGSSSPTTHFSSSSHGLTKL